MALKKKVETTEEAKKVEYDLKVIRATQFDDSCAGFDLQVNGITIYGMIYREYVNKKGEEGVIIDFPSRKGTGKYSDKYFKHCWFPMTLADKQNICNQVMHILNEV